MIAQPYGTGGGAGRRAANSRKNHNQERGCNNDLMIPKCGVVSVRLDMSALTSTTETTIHNVPEIQYVSFALLLTNMQPERQTVDKSDRYARFTTSAARIGQLAYSC